MTRLGWLGLPLLLGAVIPQYSRPTVVVVDFTTEGWPRNGQSLDSVARLATRELVLALARDTTVQFLPRRVEERPRPLGGKPSAANNAVGGTVRETQRAGRWIHWTLVAVLDERIIARDSVELGPGTEAAAAGVIAARISASLAPARVTPP